MMGMFSMMGYPKGKLIKSIITEELSEMFNRYGIDPNKYVVYSGLIQVNEIIEDYNLLPEDKIILAKWSLDIEEKLLDAEKIMLDTLTKLFTDNPILECHKMNFPILNPMIVSKLETDRKKTYEEAKKTLLNLTK